MIHYGLYKGKRYYPDKKFEESTGIIGRKEIVTLGYPCLIDEEEIFYFIEYNYNSELFKELYRPTGKYINRARQVEILTEVEAINLYESEKKKLKHGEQLIFGELYDGIKLEGITDAEFCGFELMNDGCALSAHFGFGDVLSSYKLNKYGLFDTYDEALVAQKQLTEANLDSDLNNCLIYRVWRFTKPD